MKEINDANILKGDLILDFENRRVMVLCNYPGSPSKLQNFITFEAIQDLNKQIEEDSEGENKMDSKQAQEHLTEARTALKDSVGMTTLDGAARFFLKSVANSLLVIASVVADVEFKDTDHVGCMEGKNNGGGRNGSV